MPFRVYCRSKNVANPIFTLKGPKHEIFEGGFFTQIRPVRLDDLGTGEKIWHFASWSLYLKVFATNILFSVCQHALKNPKNFKIAPPKKLCEMPWEPL
jgi:hypothetical protein